MKKSVYIFFIVSFVMLSSCGVASSGKMVGSGKIITKKYSVSGFDVVSLSLPGTMTIAQGQEESLEIQGDQNLINHIQVDVKGTTLEIKSKKNLHPSKPFLFELKLIQLNKLNISGSAKANSNSIVTDKLDINISGDGKTTISSLKSKNVKVTISGSGKCVLNGTIDDQQIKISGSGDYEAKNLKSKNSDITISGSGNAVVYVSDSLDAKISGSGSVSYYGKAKPRIATSGSGKVQHLK